MRVDSHHHFWNYDASEYGWIGEGMDVLKRDFGNDELAAVATPSGITAAVSVQARQTLEETNWLLSLADQHELVAGVVGWVPLAKSDVDSHLDQLHRNELLKGVRHVVHDEPDDRFILGEAFNKGVGKLSGYGLVYDILIFAKHLPATIEFVDKHPNQPFVVDHIAKPTIKKARFDEEWAKNLKELAKRKNVSCKFSGVVTEVRDEDWSVDLIRPYWDVALDAFGAERLMFGSDWPVCLLRSEYAKWVATVEELSSKLSEDEQEAFWLNNAALAYGLTL